MTKETQGYIQSGDVAIFYRKFGKPGATPILLFHGGNYYDSTDWIGIAQSLSLDREVAAFDSRAFGESGWSASKNYSHAAHIADALAVLDHLGWTSAIFVGHSRGGAYALLLAARHPDRAAGLVIIDYCPGFGIGPRGMPIVTTQSIGNRAKMFANSDAALASTSRFSGVAKESAYRQRFEGVLGTVEGGVIIAKRDPDFANQIPTIPSSTPGLEVGDMWRELERVRAPTLVFRALKSTAAYNDEDMLRLRNEHPDIDVADVESGHDVPAEAPDDLVRGIKIWITQCHSGSKYQ